VISLPHLCAQGDPVDEEVSRRRLQHCGQVRCVLCERISGYVLCASKWMEATEEEGARRITFGVVSFCLSVSDLLTHSHSLTYVVSPSTPALAIASVKPVVEDNAIHFHVLDRTPLPVPPTRPPITLARYRSCGSVQPSATLISQSLCMCVCVYVCLLCSFQPGGMLVRGHHQYTTQGWAELLGYYVERVLGM
jgi:hypothetical protein